LKDRDSHELSRTRSVSAAPLFFGVVDAGLNRLLQHASLMLAPAFHNGLLAYGEDGSVRRSRCEMFHLVKKRGILTEKRFVSGVDLERDRRP
jgi:hypothetical protein